MELLDNIFTSDVTFLVILAVFSALADGFWFLLLSLPLGCAFKWLMYSYRCSERRLVRFCTAVGWVIQLGTCLYITISFSFLGYPAYSIFYPLMIPVLFAAQAAAAFLYIRRIDAHISNKEILLRTLLAEAAATVTNLLLGLCLLPQVVICY